MAMALQQPSEKINKYLAEVFNGAVRAKELVEQILLFGRQVEKERMPVKLDLIVYEVLRLIRPTIPSSIEIRQDIDSSCTQVIADASQVHQVIVNLCTNAWQAMQDSGGVLTIMLKEVDIEKAVAEAYPNLSAGRYN